MKFTNIYNDIFVLHDIMDIIDTHILYVDAYYLFI